MATKKSAAANERQEQPYAVLVVDDDEAYLDTIVRALSESGYGAQGATDAAKARALLKKMRPTACVVDLVMPGAGGQVLCREISKTTRAGIIVASAIDSVDERVRVLETGADDYIVKPFEPRELVARLSALIRRMENARAAPAASIEYAGWRYSVGDRRLHFQDGRSVALTPGENLILDYLTRNPGIVVSREDLLAVSRARSYSGPQDRSVDMLISRLRAKIEPDPDSPTLLRTVWGRGYVFGEQ